MIGARWERWKTEIRWAVRQRPFGLPPAGGRFDHASFLAVTALVSLGTLLVFSATALGTGDGAEGGLAWGPLVRHLASVGAGALAFLGALTLKPRTLRWLSKSLVWFSLVLLWLVLVPGLGRKEFGSTRWLDLGGFRFQPSEVAKLGMGLFLSNYLAGFRSVLQDWRKGLVPMAVALALVVAPLFLEPDMGSIFLLILLATLMVAVAGTRLRYLAMLFGAAVVGLLVLFVQDPVRFARLVGWLFPNLSYQGAGHQNHYAMRFITAGGTTGTGLGAGPGHSLGYLTQSSSDFIFSVAGEELGFVGVVGIVLLFAVLAIQGIRLVHRCREDFQRFAAFALTLLLVLPAWIHMMVNMGMVPTKGIACPFLSFGGSSMVVSLAAAGLLQRLHLEATAAESSVEHWHLATNPPPEGAR
ncbi:MAG TPA: FtsW/RodA/SpoVE family cell cycle protein [Myxococcota bacterium]|nr:FtsW/RodA/SpoVE family cell cycle protein [Myxococcota bacterium]HQK49610.1 FtsW/RodA/SpoVE family cell cycle protein [Myxococcota bacterium]